MKDSQNSSRGRRNVRRVITVLTVVGLAAAAIVLVHRLDRTASSATVAASSPLKVVQVTSGDLATVERIDGTMQETDTVAVVHRIEGQSSLASSTPGANSAPSAPAAASASASSASASAGSQTQTFVGPACAPTTSTTSPSPPISTVSTTVPSPDATTTTVTSTTSTTVADSPVPSTSVATDPTQPCTPDSTSSTTSTSSPGTPTGAPTGSPTGAPTGGSGAPTGSASSSGSGGTGVSSSSSRVTETVTGLARVGTTVGLGDRLYSVDGRPVVALSGRLPAWRTIVAGIDDGADVQQLEQSLVSLGYDVEARVTVDDHFDAATTKMVKRWQAGLGVEQTGDVALGSVVFLATGATVTAQETSIGAAVSDGSEIVALSGTSQQVIIDVPESDRAAVVPGLEVDIDGTVGTVTLLRSAVENAVVVVQAVIAPSSPLTVADGAAVKVRVTLTNATGVLIVPADALVSRLDGTYAVQTSESPGDGRFITVDVVAVSGGDVGIRGDGLQVGATVFVPA